MIDYAKRFVRSEGKGVIKFLIVGGLSFLIYAGVYALLTRIVFPEANRTFMSFLSICSSAGFNFFAHRGWTYQATQARHVDQAWKYISVVVSATALQTFLFWLAVDRLGIYDGFVLVPVAGICAVYTYFTHRLFTFRKPRLDENVL
jgi:putative flippase GtrA